METWELLMQLGFAEDPEAITDSPPGLSYRGGGVIVFATRGTNQWFRESIFLTGHENTGRTLSSIQSELPLHLRDRNHLCALLRAIVSKRPGFPWTAED